MPKLKDDEFLVEMGGRFPVFGKREEKEENSVVLGGNFGDLVYHEGEYSIRKMFKKVSSKKLVVYYTDNVNHDIEVRDDGGYEVEFRKVQ